MDKQNVKCCQETCEQPLGESFWNTQYLNNSTGWDLGEVSPPIKNYVDQLTDKDVSILIPGCGNAYEAAYLLSKGFTNITLIDIAPELAARLQEKFKDNPALKVVHGDFFEHVGAYDIVFEQTFFCALDPKLRPQYAAKMHALLKDNGRLVGVLFNRTFEQQGPPFGGSATEYEALFKPYFDFKCFEPCYNSYHKRANTELFINLIKRKENAST